MTNIKSQRAKMVLFPSWGISLEKKQEVIRFRLNHSWSETKKQFPDISDATWERWMKNKDIILNTTMEVEQDKRIKRRKKKALIWKNKHPFSKYKEQHPLVVACYHANANFKRYRSKQKATFIKLEPIQLVPILKKQKLRCPITGIKLTSSNVSIDHIIPVSKGGSNLPENIRVVHKDINRMKLNYDDKFFLEMCQRVANNFKPDSLEIA